MKSKGGDKVESIQTPSNDQTNDEMPSVEGCASFLAMMDERAYSRMLLCSANQLSREILEPLSLPWMHKGNPVTRNMPFDLDDMAEILMADDGSYAPYENGPLGFGRFDVGQFRRGPLNTRLATSSDSWCSASRRSDDPGVLEVSSVTLPPFYTRTAPARKMDMDHSDSCTIDVMDGNHEYDRQAALPRGELSLRCFEYSSTRKRRKIATIRTSTKRYFISVKVNSSSSRSTIFNDLHADGASFLLDATLPAEVHNGRILSTAKALRIAENLGTYDWRHGLSNASNKGKSSSRLSCGRTRLIWTEKSPSDQPQKVFFSSLLTGARIDGAHQKRPRDIKLAIRLNGELYCRNSLSIELPTKEERFFEIFPQSSPSAYLRDAYSHPNAFCMMEDEEFIKNTLSDAPKALSERNKSRGKSLQVQPMLDSLTDANGLIGVVCSSVGKIAISSIHECFNRVAKEQSLRLCTVCWAPDIDQDNAVKECSECGVLVHPMCCYEKGETFPFISAIDADEELIWRCAVCCYKSYNQLEIGSKDALGAGPEQAKKSKRKSRLPQWLQDSHIEDASAVGRSGLTMGEIKSHGMKCALCPYEGGAMSHIRLENESVWMHEVCRTWLKRGRRNLSTSSSADSGTVLHECALCGQGEKRDNLTAADETIASTSEYYVLKCAASRCQVYFHPMCGLLSSKLVELSNEFRAGRSDVQTNPPASTSSAESSTERDRKLCSCFTLTALDCEVTTGSMGNDPGTTQVVQIPIALCGIHNPRRESSYRGLCPAARNVNADVIRIPAIR